MDAQKNFGFGNKEKTTCARCKTTVDVFQSQCKDLFLCIPCGQRMAREKTPCPSCQADITKLLRVHEVEFCEMDGSSCFIGGCCGGLPHAFNAQKTTINSSAVEGSDRRTKNKIKEWCIKDEGNNAAYDTQLESIQTQGTYVLTKHGNGFKAMPISARYTLKKSVHYRTLTLEEAEERMNTRTKCVEGYGRWMMKAAKNGPALFGVKEENIIDEDLCQKRLKRVDNDEKQKRKDDVDDEVEDNTQKGADWEHDEVFTDDEGDREPALDDMENGAGTEDEDNEEDEEEDCEDGEGCAPKDKENVMMVLNPNEKDGIQNSDGCSQHEECHNFDKEKKRKRDEDRAEGVLSPTGEASPAKNLESPPGAKKIKLTKDNIQTGSPGGDNHNMKNLESPPTEEEVRAFIKKDGGVPSKDLILAFSARLKSKEAKALFSGIMKRIAVKSKDGRVVLKEP